MLTEDDLGGLTRTRLPLPPREASPWPDEPTRPGRHYAPSNKVTLADHFDVKAVGLTFVDGYPQNLGIVEHQADYGQGFANLVREPDNPYDPNAIRVDWVDQQSGETFEVGHLPAGLAGRLAPLLDDGIEYLAISCRVLRADGYAWDRPGLSLTLQRS